MNVIEIEGATKRFGRTQALDGADLAVEEGFATGLVGPNGAGKTTLIRAMLGLIRLDSGSVRVFGLDPLRRPEEVRSGIGFIHETSVVPESLSAAELGEVGRAAYRLWDRGAYSSYLERFSIDPAARVKGLSHGARARLAVAFAFSHRARLLVLDEPANGLDPLVRRELVHVAAEELAREDRTIVVSTHVTSDLERFADFVAFMGKGRIDRRLSKVDILERYAICKATGGLFDEAPGLFLRVDRGPHGARALTDRRGEVASAFGDRVILETPSIEDLMLLEEVER